MAIPTAPTATSIVTEALNSAGIISSVEVSSLLTRATDEWLEEVKNKIAGRPVDWKILEKETVKIPDAYVQNFAIPTDCEKVLEVTFYDGSTKGTMQTAAAGTITLASDEDVSEDDAKGKLIFITSGNAKNEKSRITAYDTSTKIATISPNWATTPASGDYMISDFEQDLTFLPNESIQRVASSGYPTAISEFNGQFYLNNVPDKGTYALIIKYKINIKKLDLTDSKYTDVLSEWRNALMYGVCQKAAFNNDDDKYKTAQYEYNSEVKRLMVENQRKRTQRNNNRVLPIGGMPV